MNKQNREYPKVLIIGQTFNNDTGAGITLYNLFKEWPKENLYNIFSAQNRVSVDDKRCNSYYMLGEKEISLIWPLNLLYKINESKVITDRQNYENEINHGGNKKGGTYIKKILRQILIKTGIFHIKDIYQISDELKEWLNNIKPDVIYTALGDLNAIRFLMKINSEIDIPIVIHIWDDWISTLCKKSMFKRFWFVKFNNAFEEVLKKVHLCMGISEAMRKEYKNRYNRDFLVFHNPIDVDVWLQNEIKDNKKSFKTILYVGKINRDTVNEIFQLAEVIEEISLSGKFNLVFDIYTPQYEIYRKKFNNFDYVNILPSVPHMEIIQIIKNSDLLFLPLGFSKSSIEYTKLSMPTKATEFMISGVPILVFAPVGSAVYEYAKSEKWGFVVENNDQQKLKDSVLTLLNDDILRKQLTETSVHIAISKHSATVIRENFRNKIRSICYE